MDDISSYIKYIIIAAILAFRFFISGKKKEQLSNKKTKPAKRTGTTKSTTSLGDILRELSGESTTAVSEPQPVSSTMDSRSETEDSQYEFDSEQSYRTDSVGVEPSTKKLEGLGRIQLEEENGDVDFDLRKAIIAEAILTRPQY
jgi:hypothetical protein